MAPASFSICILGDLNIELSATASGISFREMNSDAFVYSPIDVAIGGTAANLALASAARFTTVNVVGQVGEDEFGMMVASRLAAARVTLHVERIPGISTGRVLYIRDSSDERQHGLRLLLIDRGANRLLSADYVASRASVIGSSDLLFVDGYSLLEQPRRSAAELAMHIAKQNGRLVAFDLVPHDAHRFFTQHEFATWMSSVDILITEVRTVRRVHGFVSNDEVYDDRTAHDTWEFLRSQYRGRAFFLRFGSGNIDRSLVARPQGHLVWKTTGYRSTADPRGFGDRLSATELAEYLIWQHPH